MISSEKLTKILYILTFSVTCLLNAEQTANFKNSEQEEGSNEIFLPPTIFNYKGADARSVWLGLTSLPSPTINMVKGIQNELKKILKGGFYERNNNLHVTLKYLGNINPSHYAVNTLEKALGKMLIFSMRMYPHDLHILNNRDGSPRLIVLTLDSPNLKLLRKSLENALEGFSGRDSRDYWPHITIYSFPRGAKPLSKDTIDDIQAIEIPNTSFSISRFELVETNKQERNGAPIVLKVFKPRPTI